MNIKKKPAVLGIVIVFSGALCFSGKAIIIKLAYRYGVDPVSLLVLRMIFSFPFFITTAIITNKTRPIKTISYLEWTYVILLGIVGYYLASLFDFQGLKYVSASIERLILFIYPTFVVILNKILFKNEMTKAQILALVITYAGILIAYRFDISLQSENGTRGTILILLSAVCYAIYLIGSERMIPKFGTVNYTSWAMIISTIASLLHFYMLSPIDLLNLPTPVYFLAIIMAIFSTIIPSFLISEGIRIIGSSKASIVGTIGPVSTIVLAHIFLNESLNLYQYLGTFIVIAELLELLKGNKNYKLNCAENFIPKGFAL